MKRVKGCINKECAQCRNQTRFKGKEEVCDQCGSRLAYVCKHPKCFKQLPVDGKEAYCSVHTAERKDQKERAVKNAMKAGEIALSVAGTLYVIGKKFLFNDKQ